MRLGGVSRTVLGALLLACARLPPVPEPITPGTATAPAGGAAAPQPRDCGLRLQGPAEVRVLDAERAFVVGLAPGVPLEVAGFEGDELRVVHEGSLRFEGRLDVVDAALALARERELASGLVLPAGLRVVRLRREPGARVAATVRVAAGVVGFEEYTYPVEVDVGAVRCEAITQRLRAVGEGLEPLEAGDLAFVDGPLELQPSPGAAGTILTPTEGRFPVHVVERLGSHARVVLAHAGGVRLAGWAPLDRLRAPTPMERRSLRFDRGGSPVSLLASLQGSPAPRPTSELPTVRAALRVGADVRSEPAGAVWATVRRPEGFRVHVPAGREWVALVAADGLDASSLVQPPRVDLAALFGLPQRADERGPVFRGWVRRSDVTFKGLPRSPRPSVDGRRASPGEVRPRPR